LQPQQQSLAEALKFQFLAISNSDLQHPCVVQLQPNHFCPSCDKKVVGTPTIHEGCDFVFTQHSSHIVPAWEIL